MKQWASNSVFILSICFALIIAILFGAKADMANASENKLVIAHRGASGYLPEHTLAAKAMAHAMGADYIEQDVVLTKDGIAIILHDIHLGTVTDVADKFPLRKRDDGRYYAIDFTLKEIKTLFVHERTRKGSSSSVFPNRFPQNKSNFRVPTFVEEIELIQGLNKSTGRDIGIYPEIKAPKFHMENGQDLSKAVLKILDAYGYNSKTANIIMQCFNWDETKRLRELGYKGKLIQLLGENNWGISPDTDFDFLKSADGMKEMAKTVDGVGPWINQIVVGLDSDGEPQFTDLVSDAKAAGLYVHPYTARADALPQWAKSYDELLGVLFDKAKVDGIFTDFPDLGVAFVSRP